MDVQQLIEQLRRCLVQARAIPLSTSAVVNRANLLSLISQLDEALSQAFAASDTVYLERDEVVANARREAEQIVDDAHSERDRLVSESVVFVLAKREADRMLSDTATESAALRQETDEYVDRRLANFEVALAKTLEAVARGRERLRGRSGLDDLDHDDLAFQFPESD